MPRLNLVCVIDDDELIRRVFEMLIANYNIA
ncbi:MAG: hypothetical protein JWR67_2945, partial [Mucilaginibacter sp.]|nr:hypothetical protein [Mucilaginibacter sp.]